MKQREGYILSGLLHVGTLLLLWLGLPFFFQSPLEAPPPIAVDIISEEMLTSSTKAAKPKEPKQAEAKPTPPQPEEKPEAKPQEVATSKPTPPQPEENPEPKPQEVAKAEPTPQKPEPVPMKDMMSLLDDDVMKKLNEPAQPEKPTPVTPPTPKAKPKALAQKKPEDKKKDSAFDSLLSNVTEKQPKPQPVSHTTGAENGAEDDITKILSASELDALRRQVASCWNVPAGARDANDLVVDVHVEMDPQGQVALAKVVGGNQGHPYFKAGSESAVRALNNPRCKQLKIPPHRRAEMQSFTFRFNPKYMF